MINKVWLSPEILDWNSSVEDYIVHSRDVWERPYEIWSHVEKKLKQIGTEFDRVDSITSLKRCVDYRIRVIKDIYNFKNIPIKDKPKESLELLEYFGIIRPIMVQKLIDIRNAVEHEDASPPSYDECLSFLEFVWYFLRSTDHLVRQSVHWFVLHPELSFDNNYYASMKVGSLHGWIFEIDAWIRPMQIKNDHPNEPWITIMVKNIENREDVFNQYDDPFKKEIFTEYIGGREPEDIHLIGEVRGPSNHLLSLLKVYFDLL